MSGFCSLYRLHGGLGTRPDSRAASQGGCVATPAGRSCLAGHPMIFMRTPLTALVACGRLLHCMGCRKPTFGMWSATGQEPLLSSFVRGMYASTRSTFKALTNFWPGLSPAQTSSYWIVQYVMTRCASARNAMNSVAAWCSRILPQVRRLRVPRCMAAAQTAVLTDCREFGPLLVRLDFDRSPGTERARPSIGLRSDATCWSAANPALQCRDRCSFQLLCSGPHAFPDWFAYNCPSGTGGNAKCTHVRTPALMRAS